MENHFLYQVDQWGYIIGPYTDEEADNSTSRNSANWHGFNGTREQFIEFRDETNDRVRKQYFYA